MNCCIYYFNKIFKTIFELLIWLVCLPLPVNNKKVVFCNFYGRGYGDNPKYIVQKLLKDDANLSLYWLVKNNKETLSLPKEIIACKTTSIVRIYHLATAKVWVDNCRKHFPVFKKRNQFFVQTWHGFALKKIEKDAAESFSKFFVKTAPQNSKLIDCIISDSDFMTKIYENSFWYDGPVYKWGSPRNDILVSNTVDFKTKICNCFNIPTTKNLVIYAPTFRNNLSTDVYSLDFLRLKDACERRFGGDFAVLVRLHPNIATKSKNIDYDNINIINATYYPDLQEILAACDIVVSDYSSLMFDFALSGRPCFQFAVDIEDYKKDRDFYFEIDNLPFPLAESNDELEKNILLFDNNKYLYTLNNFYASVGMVKDGLSSKKCADLIKSVCLKRKNR